MTPYIVGIINQVILMFLFSTQVLFRGIAVHNRNGIRGPGRCQFTSFINVYVFEDIAVMIIDGVQFGIVVHLSGCTGSSGKNITRLKFQVRIRFRLKVATHRRWELMVTRQVRVLIKWRVTTHRGWDMMGTRRNEVRSTIRDLIKLRVTAHRGWDLTVTLPTAETVSEPRTLIKHYESVTTSCVAHKNLDVEPCHDTNSTQNIHEHVELVYAYYTMNDRINNFENLDAIPSCIHQI